MRISRFRRRVLAREKLVGTFLRVPAVENVEVLAKTGLDFICLDAEHAAFDRARMDTCLAVARALDFPVLVRVLAGRAENILMVLDAGAVGVVVPHVLNADQARQIAKSAHFGLGGRGFHGGTRWAGHGGMTMAKLMEKSEAETVVMAQIEEPEGVDAAAQIAGVSGIDALFIGPSDLSIGYGHQDLDSDDLKQAFHDVGQAARDHGKALVTYVSTPEEAQRWKGLGVDIHLVSSEQGWIISAARDVVTAMKAANERSI